MYERMTIVLLLTLIPFNALENAIYIIICKIIIASCQTNNALLSSTMMER